MASPAPAVEPKPAPAAVPAAAAVEPKPAPAAAPAAPPPPAPAALRAIVLTSSLGVLRVTEPGAHVLGRGTDASLRLQHPTVSRRHARVILADDRSTAYVQDAGGANGTFHNGLQISQLAALSEGDRIRVGEVELTVSLQR